MAIIAKCEFSRKKSLNNFESELNNEHCQAKCSADHIFISEDIKKKGANKIINFVILNLFFNI